MNFSLSIREDAPIPARCPKCGDAAGQPFMAGTSCEDDRIRVGMRCSHCKHEWRYEMPSAKPKVDRRASPRFY